MDQHRIPPGSKLELGSVSCGPPEGITKQDAKKKTKQLNRKLEELQELLYAEGKHRLLVVLQAMDTGGKDGVIRMVFDGVNPLGVKVASFKKPSAEELAHDYLWRIHRQTPGLGEITVFNRSHYEDVLVVRVHQLVPQTIWSKRFHQINAFEQTLVEEGTTILKFYLHIDRDEQKRRLQSRLDDPTKGWKFNLGDLQERKRWDEYLAAYADAISATSTDPAPWYVVPANKKWYRNLVVSQVIVSTLEGFSMAYPAPSADLSNVVIE